MCNACGFYCCAWDGFEKCGCDHCPDPKCRDDDEDDFDDCDGTFDGDCETPDAVRCPGRDDVP